MDVPSYTYWWVSLESLASLIPCCNSSYPPFSSSSSCVRAVIIEYVNDRRGTTKYCWYGIISDCGTCGACAFVKHLTGGNEDQEQRMPISGLRNSLFSGEHVHKCVLVVIIEY